jgi:hypothetical protein
MCVFHSPCPVALSDDVLMLHSSRKIDKKNGPRLAQNLQSACLLKYSESGGYPLEGKVMNKK